LGKNENIRKETKMTTEERLEKLERELAVAKRCNRRLLTFVAMTIGGLALVWTLTKTTSAAYAQEVEAVQKVVRANSFALVDENGKTRAMLGTTKDGTMLSLLDENGVLRAGLGVLKNGSELTLFGENGNKRAGLSVNRYGPGLALYDENGKNRAMLVVAENQPGLTLSDENGKPRAILGVFKSGPVLGLRDENGKDIWSAP
jgi:hypothetical protein